MEIAINNSIYKQASDYAKEQGLNLTSVIENFLKRFIVRSKTVAEEQKIPDVVKSLLGAGENIADNDLNARELYSKYLEEKYR
jgi:antitoxin component of RelBE/YafQ-DinJ toxin-antitoxin module